MDLPAAEHAIRVLSRFSFVSSFFALMIHHAEVRRYQGACAQ